MISSTKSLHVLAVMFLGALTILPLAPARAEKVIEWTNLLPDAPPLNDPFSSLTQDQRFDIETVIWARSLSTEEKELDYNRLPVEDAARYEKQFEKAGFSVTKMLEDYLVFQAEIAKRQEQVNGSLNGVNVKIAGYLLPLEFSEKGEKDFLLVPYVGACVHVPPPPANQMVLVRLAKTKVVKDLYTPVWISGQMKTIRSNAALNLSDGSMQVPVGYNIDQAKAIEFVGR